MTTTTTGELIGIILGSNVVLEFIKYFLSSKQRKAGTIKLKNEAGQIVLEGELKVTEFYKQQLEAILSKYSELEQKLNEEISNHRQCQIQIQDLTTKHNDLQRQFTLFKIQHT